MSEMPSERVLSWAAGAVGTGARVVAMKCLHEGRTGPWLLRIDRGGETTEVVLRVVVPGWIGEELIATGAAALRLAEEHGLAAPRLIASDLDSHSTGEVVTLETVAPGSSGMPDRMSAERLREAGRAIAKVHKVSLEPQAFLPLRIRPIQVDDFALERRWANLYHASSETEKPAVIDALCELTGRSAEHARQMMSSTRSSALLQLADDCVREHGRPQGDTVFVHGDAWAGNLMWNGDTCTALIDWKTAGAGDPGVDLGELRKQMALQYGPAAPAYVLDGWQRESGRRATNVAYWDAVAALQTSADLDDWEPGFTARRDAFLREALDRLAREGVTYE